MQSWTLATKRTTKDKAGWMNTKCLQGYIQHKCTSIYIDANYSQTVYKWENVSTENWLVGNFRHVIELKSA